jgi:hypothetical protein
MKWFLCLDASGQTSKIYRLFTIAPKCHYSFDIQVLWKLFGSVSWGIPIVLVLQTLLNGRIYLDRKAIVRHLLTQTGGKNEKYCEFADGGSGIESESWTDNVDVWTC